jgi:ankyrin repeat protein
MDGHAGIVDQLLVAGARPNAVGGRGVTPLHLAAYHGNERIIRRLLRAGADRKRENQDGRTAAQVAERNGHPSALLPGDSAE